MLNFAMAKRTWAQDACDDTMVIRARKGKDKGKDEGRGRSSGKDHDGKCKIKDKNFSQSMYHCESGERPNADKERYYCKKVGHLKADSRKFKADAASGKVDAKAKAPAAASGARGIERPEQSAGRVSARLGAARLGGWQRPTLAPQSADSGASD